MVKKISDILEQSSKLEQNQKMFLLQNLIDEMFKTSVNQAVRKKVEQDLEQLILNMLDKNIAEKNVLVFLGNIASKYVDRHPETKKQLSLVEEEPEDDYVS